MLPSNIKISLEESHTANPPHDMQTYFLNLSDEEFDAILSKIYSRKDVYDKLKIERDIAKRVYLELSKKHNFSVMTSKQKMDFMFDWVRNKYEYDYSQLESDGNYRMDADRSLSSDPIEVFRRGKGVCTGRSRLLKILLNNPYMNVQCYTVLGKYNDRLPHEWNEFVDENNQVWEYDLSFR